VTKVWKKAKIHEKIAEVLTTENLLPYALLTTWPSTNMWVPLAIDPIALALFGEVCYSNNVEWV
jgi:hypothetical protein